MILDFFKKYKYNTILHSLEIGGIIFFQPLSVDF